MPRQFDDDDDNDDISPEHHGWSREEWEELLEIFDVNDEDELLDMFPDALDFGDWFDELDYLNELDNLGDDNDFYSVAK